MMNRVKYMLLAAAICALAGCAKPAHKLVILHVNDTHSHFEPQRDGEGGIIERAAFVDSVRAAEGDRNVLLLHAGDFNQGTSYFTILGGQLEVDMINAMKYDVITLGNHEFDNGVEDLMARVNRIQCPVVCANYDFSIFEGGDKVKPYAIVEKAGRKIGVIGLLCDIRVVVARAIADRVPVIGSCEEVANKWAKYLREEEKCDIVMLLTHIGYQEDKELVPLLHGVDLVVGGHSHTFIPDPAICTDADGKTVPVVQDGCWGAEVAQLTLKF